MMGLTAKQLELLEWRRSNPNACLTEAALALGYKGRSTMYARWRRIESRMAAFRRAQERAARRLIYIDGKPYRFIPKTRSERN